jgi:hypothetical protein
MISRIVDESSRLSSSRKLSKSATTRRRLQTVLVGPARSALPEGVAAARPSSSRRTGLLAATTRMMMMI